MAQAPPIGIPPGPAFGSAKSLPKDWPPRPSAPAFDARSWEGMSEGQKLGALRDGRSLRAQFSFFGGEPLWRHLHFEGGSPLASLALSGRPHLVQEALALGACPLASAPWGGDALSMILNAKADDPGFAFVPPFGDPSQSALLESFKLCWDACSGFFDPASPEFLGSQASSLYLGRLAVDARANRLDGDLASLGVHLPPELFIAHQHGALEWVRTSALGWGSPQDLRQLVLCGFDLLSPIRDGLDPSDHHSQWAWCGEWGADALERCVVLLDHGNDPRLPDLNGRIPLEALEDSGFGDIVADLRLLLASRDEAAMLDLLVPAAPSKPRPPP